MARGGVEWRRGARRCSYKSAAAAVCCINLVVALYILRLLYPSLHSSGFKYTADQIRRIEDSIRVRREMVPLELVRLTKELAKEFADEERRWELSRPVREMLTNEVLQELRRVENGANATELREALELWRAEKLKAVRKVALSNSASNLSLSLKEAKMLETALESDWLRLSEDIGLWIPLDVINNEINDKPANEIEDEYVIPGPPLPPECHAEPHTDYDGAAVRWGLKHHKDSAADCCQACLDQAKHAKPSEMKCNIWVYCPSESGCYSPDIYQHHHQECWLKQAINPRLNFKDKYSESYRNSHPKAPVDVPWISGVIST